MDCRSHACLRVSRFPQPTPDPAMDPWLRELTQKLRQNLDPLAPGRRDLRYVAVREAYCTRSCEVDDDCPQGFACAD